MKEYQENPSFSYLFKKLWNGYPLVFSLCILGSILTALIALIEPKIMGHAIDYVLQDGLSLEEKKGQIWQWTLLILTLLSAGAIIDYLSLAGLNIIGYRIICEIRQECFNKMLRLPQSYFDKNPTGVIVTRICNDTEALSKFFFYVIGQSFTSLLTVFGVLIAYWLTTPQLAPIFCLSTPAIFLITYSFIRQATPLWQAYRTQIGRINAAIQESMQGAKVIKSHQLQANFYQKFQQNSQENYETSIDLIRAFAKFRPAIVVVSFITQILILSWGSYWLGLQAPELTYGELTTALLFTKMFFAPLGMLSERFNIYQSSKVALQRIQHLLNLPQDRFLEDKGQASDQLQGEIQLIDLSHSYDGQKKVLKDLSLSFESNKQTAIIGPTGSGKSTLVQLILGIYPTQDSSILIDGHPFSYWKAEHLKKNIGYIPQHPILLEDDLFANMTLYHPYSQEEVQGVLQQIGLEHIPLDQKELKLSSGEKQLVSIGRVLLQKPKILILDEATANIDSLTEEKIHQLLDEIRQQCTTILIAHRLSTIKDVDKIIILQEGELLEEGSPQDLRQDQESYYTQLLEKSKEN